MKSKILTLVTMMSLMLAGCRRKKPTSSSVYVETHLVKFYINGIKVDDMKVEDGMLASLPDIEPKPGYTLSDWHIGENGKGIWDFSEDRVTDDVSLYAEYTANEYTVTFVDNERNQSFDSRKVTYDASFDFTSYKADSSQMTLTWVDSKGNSLPSSGIWKVASDFTYYAHYTERAYRITYDLGGGENSPSNPDSYTVSQKVIDLSEPTRKGYEFTGWTLNLDGSAVTRINCALMQDITLTAHWKIIHYTITYQLDDDVTNDPSNPTSYTIEDGTILLKDPKREDKGYTFKEWLMEGYDGEYYSYYETRNGYSNRGSSIDCSACTNLLVCPSWEGNTYHYTFDAGDGSVGIKQMDIMYGSQYGLPYPTAPSKPDKTAAGVTWKYIFDAWYIGDERISNATGESWSVAKGGTLTAHYAYKIPETEIDFGRYPQTHVSDAALISNLNALNTANSKGWYEYDSDNDGTMEEYAKAEGHPNHSGYSFSDGTKIVDGTTYWFKVENLKAKKIWHPEDGSYTFVSERILAPAQFYSGYDGRDDSYRTIHGKRAYSSNYRYSNLRAWMNSYDGSSYDVDNYTGKGFYDVAFTDEEKAIISTTTVDNSLKSTGYSSNLYVCEDTEDKVYALSYKEVGSFWTSGSERAAELTDYALALGAEKSTYIKGNGWYWLRSPADYGSGYAWCVQDDGDININGGYVSNASRGVRPALSIKVD